MILAPATKSWSTAQRPRPAKMLFSVLNVERLNNNSQLAVERSMLNLDKQNSVTATGALVQFGGSCGTVEGGGDEVFVKI